MTDTTTEDTEFMDRLDKATLKISETSGAYAALAVEAAELGKRIRALNWAFYYDPNDGSSSQPRMVVNTLGEMGDHANHLDRVSLLLYGHSGAWANEGDRITAEAKRDVG